jgi:protein phosphatase
MHVDDETGGEAGAGKLLIQVGTFTDVGEVREQNEDSFLVCPDLTMGSWEPPRLPLELGRLGALLVVADGMGGENAGEVASALAVDAVRSFFSGPALQQTLYSEEESGKVLVDAIRAAHEKIVSHAGHHPECRGMGTTILLVWVLGRKAYYGWSGDSRLYLYREGEGLRLVSDDHSVVWELVMNGHLTADEAEHHPGSHLITQSLGDPGYPPRPDVRVQPLRPGDRLLLCSDGLNGMVPFGDIQSTVGKKLPPAVICEELVRAANLNGGQDNTTVVLLEVLRDPTEGILPANTVSGLEAAPLPPRERAPEAGPSGGIGPETALPGGTLSTTVHVKKYLLYALGVVALLVVICFLYRQSMPFRTISSTGVQAKPDNPTDLGDYELPAQDPDSSLRPDASAQVREEPVPPSPAGNTSPTSTFSLPEASVKRISREAEALLERYTLLVRQVDTLSAASSGGPVPNKAGLERAAIRIPGYAGSRKPVSREGLQRLLRTQIKTQAELNAVENDLRILKDELEDLEGKLKNQTSPGAKE